jgi:alanine-synthesizing transaminase
MRYSNRVPNDLNPGPWAEELARHSQGTLIDLTISNPTLAGLAIDADELRRVFLNINDSVYTPAPRVDPAQRVWFTSGTSEAYAYLFKLLADPGDEILIPSPSYPLFQHLLDLESIRPVSYRISFDSRWKIDFDSIASAVTGKSRALVIVHPNNPTGSYASTEEMRKLVEISEQKGIALISDEVFLPYAHSTETALVSFSEMPTQGLTFVLDGLSKKYGLPQLKVSWISAHGSEALLSETEKRLDWISDLYLSVPPAIQRALPQIGPIGQTNQKRILERVRQNRGTLARFCKENNRCVDVSGEGGWMGLVRLPDHVDEEKLVLRLLKETGVSIHPGYFFDLPFQSSLAISLLVPPAELVQGLNAVELTL